jgi:hypothetical protein
MIHCPSCGAANRDASRFCNECGAALPSAAGVRCPMCGKMNPPGNVFCDSCGARVVPMAAAGPEPKPSETTVVKKGLSLPTKPSGELPATGPAARVRPTPPTPAPPPAQPAAPGEPDDWLSRLRGTLPTEQPAEVQPSADESVPDWLRDLGNEPAVPGAQAVTPVFDLAARLGGVEPSEPAPTSVEPEVPDWIARLGTPATKPPAPIEPEVPDWLAAKPSTPQATKLPAPATPPVEAEIPDWLKPPSPAPTPAVEVDVPDWLKQPSPAPAEAEAPDWLSQLAPTPAITEPSAPAVSPVESEVPDWLAQLPSVPVAATPSTPAVLPVESEAPDWLSQLAPPPAVEEPSVPAESPDWLARLSPTAAIPPVPSEPEAVPSIESEAPDWLAQLSPLAVAPEPELTPVAEPAKPGPALIGEQIPEPEETPAWLADMGSPQPAPGAPVLTETPDWLKELETKPSPVPSESKTESPSPFAEPVVLPPGEMPAWLQELTPVEAVAPTAGVLAGVPVPPVPGEGGLVAAQLPSWLQGLGPKEPVAVAPPKVEEEPAETEGVLAGVRGALPVAPIALQMSGTGISVSPEIPAGDLAGAGALQELLARGMTAVVRREGESRAGRLEGKVWRWFVLLLIAFAVITPLVLGSGLSLVSAPPPLPATGNTMYDSIQKLAPGTQVLVAFDYDATQAPEMDVLARVVMRHLIARQAHIEVVSLYPTGPAVAQVVINSILPVTSPVKMDVTNRGYWPGQTTAVASLVTEPRDKPPRDKPLNMVIELAATPDTLRWWVEQMTGRPETLLAGVSASVEPVAQPYAASPQLKGLLAGVPGAIAYQFKLRGALPQTEQQNPADLLVPLNSIAVANVALVFVMIIGGVIQLLSGRGSPSGDERRRG